MTGPTIRLSIDKPVTLEEIDVWVRLAAALGFPLESEVACTMTGILSVENAIDQIAPPPPIEEESAS